MTTQQTSTQSALRAIDRFILDAVGRQHRETQTVIEVSPESYKDCWGKILHGHNKPCTNKIREIEEDGENSVSMYYNANNHKYELRILKGAMLLAA